MSKNHQHAPAESAKNIKTKSSASKIFIAFLLNLGFSIYEFFGGIFTGSTAIMSDAVHDFGDAFSIGVAFFFEKRSQKHPDEKFTYGYARYSLVGGIITTVVLLIGSAFVITNAISRFFSPITINYSGMIWLSVIGVVVNFAAAYVTHDHGSLNQKSVNLHLLEDVLGWIVVLIGAIVMNFTDIALIDPILSIGVAIFILWQAAGNFKSIFDIFLEKTPTGISPRALEKQLAKIAGVKNVHHLHVWSLDGENHFATLHVVTNAPSKKSSTQTKSDAEIKKLVKAELAKHQITHSTIEIEAPSEMCADEGCN